MPRLTASFRGGSRPASSDRSCCRFAIPNLDMEGAYAIQKAAWIRSKQFEEGRKKLGWKIGLTSRAMQQALEASTFLTAAFFWMTWHSPMAPSSRLAAFIQPRIEAEIAFRDE